MTRATATELVDLVEDRIRAAGEEWSCPLVIKRLRDLEYTADAALFAGLAQVLEEALECAG